MMIGSDVHLTPTFFGRIIGRAGNWRIDLTDRALSIRQGSQWVQVELTELSDVKVTEAGLWLLVTIGAPSGEIKLSGADKGSALAFQQRVATKAVSAICQEADRAAAGVIEDKDVDQFYAQQRYLSRRDIGKWIDTLLAANAEMPRVLQLLKHRWLVGSANLSRLSSKLARIRDLAIGPATELTSRNASFVISELERHKAFFDSIEARPLTEEQRRAAIISEDRNLVVAAAGSGKTSTIVAKIGYTLTTNACEPREVLTIAFNRSAADELRGRVVQRLAGKFGNAEELTAKTFHKVGLDIISAVEGKKPELAPWAGETRDNEGAVIDELIAEMSSRDASFMLRWHMFLALAARQNKELSGFANEADYNAYLAQVGEDRGGHKGIRTLNGELVKSMEELAIANWLFLNGVPYVYEVSYEYDTADQEHRQYHPDFYYSDIDCYHEHFALDDKGRPARFLSGDYAAGVEWKRELHAVSATALIETTSAMHREGTLFLELERQLTTRGQTLRPRSAQEVQERLSELRIPPLAGLIKTFITLAKSSGTKPSDLINAISTQQDKFRARMFVNVVKDIFTAYEDALRALRCIDFEDMIWLAIRHLEAGRYVHPFKFILIDEFQDISLCRARLIRAMLDQNPDCKLFAVGDDWQSIYRFTGADQSIMANFEREFGATSTTYLTRTFRSNQGIADCSSAFVQRNPAQIRKRIRAADTRTNSTVHILEYRQDADVDQVLESEIQILADHAAKRSAKISILILARFRHLRPKGLDAWRKRFSDCVDVQFLTLHRSKGLEADYIFILAANSGTYGLPSAMEDDPLLRMVLPNPEGFEFAEERRLFYVGLTRAKHRCYVLTQQGRTSPFVRELFSEGDAVVYRVGTPRPTPVAAKPCDRCSTGVLREVSGKRGQFLGCSNFPQCEATVSIHSI